MKKAIIIAALMLPLMAMAQTEFRHISFKEALVAAKAENKLVFVDFYTSWCGPCKNMAKNVFPEKSIGEYMNSKFVCVKYDAEKEELALVKQCKVNAYPTFVIFSADGKEVGRKVGGSTADRFPSEIEMIANPDLSPENIEKRYNAGERTPQLIKAYGNLLSEQIGQGRRYNKEKADQLYGMINSYFAGLTDKDKLKSENLFLYREYGKGVNDEKIQYLYANRAKAVGDIKAEVDSILKKKYTYGLYYYVNFDNGEGEPAESFDKAGYDKFRTEFVSLGLNTGENKTMLDIVDVYASKGLDEYLAYVEKIEYKGEDYEYTVLSGLGNAFANADQATKNRAAMVIRKQLINIPAVNIYFLAMTIGKLEGTIGH